MSNLAYKLDDQEDDEDFLQSLREREERKKQFRLINGGGRDDESTIDDPDDDYSDADDNVIDLNERRAKKEDSVSDLQAQEERSGSDTDSPFTYSDEKKSRVSGLAKSSRKKLIFGSLFGAGAIAGIIGGVISFLPLKIMHITNNLEKDSFSSVNSAVDRAQERFLSNYFKKHVIPGLTNNSICRSTKTIDKSCYAAIPGQNPVERLYSTWRDARLENRLANKYGIEFARKGNQYTISINGNVNTINDIEGWRKNPDLDLWQAVGSKDDVRRELRKALSEETKYLRALKLYGLGSFVERKYGVTRCVFACSTRDKFSDWKTRKREAFQIKMARGLQRQNAVLGLAMECLVSSDCDTYDSTDDDNIRRNKLEKKIDDYLKSSGQQVAGETVEKIVKTVDGVQAEGGLSKFLFREVFGETAAKITSKALPVIGWIDFGATVVRVAKNTGPAIKRARYAVLSVTAVQTAMAYLSHRDEIKNGRVDMELMGSVADSLGDAVGGKDYSGWPAESSPLYQKIMGTGTSSTTSFNIFDSKAYATSQTAKPPCDDGAVMTARICPEEMFATNNVATDVGKAFQTAPLNALGGIADVWEATYGRIRGIPSAILQKAIENDPALQIVQQKIGEISQGLVTTAAKYILGFPSPDNTSGVRRFNTAAAGFDVMALEYGQYGLGAQEVSNAEMAAIKLDQKQQQDYEFNSKSFAARMFDTEDSQSFVSRVAIAMPSSVLASGQNIAVSLSSPISLFTKGLASFSSSPKVSAAEDLQNCTFDINSTEEQCGNDFGLPQVGYPINKPVFSTDPDNLTDATCDQATKAWTDNVKEDPNTGIDLHTTVNDCLLLAASITSGGAQYDTSLVPQRDLPNANSQAGPNTSGPIQSTFSYDEYASMSHDQLVSKILSNPNWQPQSNRPTDDIKNGIAKDDLMRLILAIVEKANVVIKPSVIKTGHKDCSGPGRTSNHYSGNAIDIGNEDIAPQLVPWLYANREALGINELIISPVPADAKTLSGGNPFTFDTTTMNDHKNHIHVSVKAPKVTSPKCGGS